jgi:hypothetical protein
MGMRQRCGKRGWFRPVFSGRVFAEAAMGTEGCSQNRGGAGACPVGVVTPKVGKHVAEKQKVSVPTGEANEPRSNGE